MHDRVVNLQFREALEAIWELVTALNARWKNANRGRCTKRDAGDQLDAVLYDLCEGLRWLAILVHPFMPEKAAEIWRQLGLPGTPEVRWRDELQWGGLAANTQTNPGAALFPRIEQIAEEPVAAQP